MIKCLASLYKKLSKFYCIKNQIFWDGKINLSINGDLV